MTTTCVPNVKSVFNELSHQTRNENELLGLGLALWSACACVCLVCVCVCVCFGCSDLIGKRG